MNGKISDSRDWEERNKSEQGGDRIRLRSHGQTARNCQSRRLWLRPSRERKKWRLGRKRVRSQESTVAREYGRKRVRSQESTVAREYSRKRVRSQRLGDTVRFQRGQVGVLKLQEIVKIVGRWRGWGMMTQLVIRGDRRRVTVSLSH